MNSSNDDTKQHDIEDILEVETGVISIETVARLASSPALIKKYRKRYGTELYSKLLIALTHKIFDEKIAQKYWNNIIAHNKSMTAALNYNPGIVAATIDYLGNIKKVLSKPKIIEESKSIFLAEVSTRDELTGLYMRDIFNLVIKKEVSASLRIKNNLGLMMIDIDDFKNINDSFGHTRGDDVLRAIGKLINKLVREMDLAARYGGEEIAIVMPGISGSNAKEIADRIRRGIEELKFSGFRVTVSIGVAFLNKPNDTIRKFINRADRALYSAKANGKNCVEINDGIK